MQDSMSDLMNRLLANTSLDALSSGVQTIDKQSKQRHLKSSQRRERAEARRRQAELEQRRIREQAEQQQLAMQQQIALMFERSQQHSYFPMSNSLSTIIKSDEVICLSDTDEDEENKPVVSNLPTNVAPNINPSSFFDMSENSPLRQFVVDIINNTTSTFITETKKQLGILALSEQFFNRCLEPNNIVRTEDIANKLLPNFDKVLTSVVQKVVEKTTNKNIEQTPVEGVSQTSVSNEPAPSPSKESTSNNTSVLLDKKCDSNSSTERDNSISVSSSDLNKSPAKTCVSSTQEASINTAAETSPSEVVTSKTNEESTSTKVANDNNASLAQEEMSMNTENRQEDQTGLNSMLTVDTELQQNSYPVDESFVADSSQITPVTLESSKPTITTPELINTCMSILSKDQTSKSTALVTTTQASQQLQSSLLLPTVSNEVMSESAASNNLPLLPDESEPAADIGRSAGDNFNESFVVINQNDNVPENNSSTNNDSNISLPRIVDCYSLKSLEIDPNESTTLQEDVTLNVSPSPKTYIDKGKEAKRSWRENKTHSDKRNKSLSPLKKVSFPDLETTDHQSQPVVRRRNSFMTPAQLKYMSSDAEISRNDSDMEIDDMFPTRDTYFHHEDSTDSGKHKDSVGKPNTEENTRHNDDITQNLNYDNILSPISPMPEIPEVTKSILKRRTVKKTSPKSRDMSSIHVAEKSILKSSKNQKGKSNLYLLKRSESPSSQDVKNRHVPVANVTPQYKQVHFLSEMHDNSNNSRKMQVPKEEKSSDIQFRLTFYKPENSPSSSKNRFAAKRRDSQQSTTPCLQSTSTMNRSVSPAQSSRNSSTGMNKLSSVNAQRETISCDKYDPLELFSDTALLVGDEPCQQVQLANATPDPALGFTDIYDSGNLLTNNSQDSGNATLSFDSNNQDNSLGINDCESPSTSGETYTYDDNLPIDARTKWLSCKVEPPAFSPASPAQSDFDEQNAEGGNGEQQTSLPFKKRRKLSVFQPSEEIKTEPVVAGPVEDVSYPATPMMSIAEVKLLQSIQQLQEGNKRGLFKTPGQLKFGPGPSTQFNNCQYTSNNQGNNMSNFQINSQVPVVNNISFNTNQNINNNFGSDISGAGCLNSLQGGAGGALSQFDLNQTMINLSNYHLSQQHLTNFLLNSIHMPQNNGSIVPTSSDQIKPSRKVQIRKCSDCKRVNCSCFAESDSDDGIVEGNTKKSQKKSRRPTTDRVTRSSNRTVAKNYKEPDDNKKRRKSGVAKRAKFEN